MWGALGALRGIGAMRTPSSSKDSSELLVFRGQMGTDGLCIPGEVSLWNLRPAHRVGMMCCVKLPGECLRLPPLPAFPFFSEWKERNTTEAWGNGRMAGAGARELELTSRGILGTGTRPPTSFLLVHSAFARNKMPFSDMGPREGGK